MTAILTSAVCLLIAAALWTLVLVVLGGRAIRADDERHDTYIAAGLDELERYVAGRS